MIELNLGRIELTPAQMRGFPPAPPFTAPRVDLLLVLQQTLRDYEQIDALLMLALERGFVTFSTSDLRANLLPKIATLRTALLHAAEGRR